MIRKTTQIALTALIQMTQELLLIYLKKSFKFQEAY